MSWWHGLILGILQGLTEFFPVSSSGHLALVQMVFNRLGWTFEQPGVVFDAMLHIGTASAVIWYERRRLRTWLTTPAGWRLIGLLVLGTVATAAVAFPLKNLATEAFEKSLVVGICLLITGLFVLSTRFLSGGPTSEGGTQWYQAVVIGLVQGLAIFPGISRSGATITAALGTGLDREWSARFSFLLSLPAIAGATLVQLIEYRAELMHVGTDFWIPLLTGGLAAAVTGLVALKVVVKTVSSRLFDRFAFYCLPLGAAVVLLSAMGVL